MYNEVLDDLTVVKRSGQRVPFNASKIAIAIKKSFDSVTDAPNEKQIFKVFEKVLTFINENYKERKTINVEDVQDIIEQKLQEEKYFDVYNSFSEYRKKRSASRKAFDEKRQHKFVRAIEKIQEENSLKTDYLSPYNTLYKFGRIVSNEYTKAYLLDNKYVRAAEEGNIYIHDIDYFALGLLSNIHLKLNTKLRDDNSIDSLLSEIINTQNEINGEITLPDLDYLLSPWFLNKYKDIFKKYLANYLNVLGLKDYINLKKLEEIIDKEENMNLNYDSYALFILNDQIKNIFKLTYEDTLSEINQIIKNVLMKIINTLENNGQRNTKFTINTGNNNDLIGLKINNELTSLLQDVSFKNLNIIFKISKIFNEDLLDKISDLIIKNKNIYLAFIDADYNKKNIEYFSTGARIFENINSNDLESVGRMIVSSTSINLARLGLKYREKNIKDFYTELDGIIELVKNELILSFETIGDKTKENYKVLFRGNVYDDEKLEENQHIRKVIKNGTLNIGIIGLKECLLSLEKDENKQYQLLVDILKYLNSKCQKFSEENKLNFGIYEPNDYKSRKELIGIDKAIYGVIEDITNKTYYELIDSLKIIKDDYQKLATIQKLFTNGELITINVIKNISSKRVSELIKELSTYNFGFVRIKAGKDEY